MPTVNILISHSNETNKFYQFIAIHRHVCDIIFYYKKDMHFKIFDSKVCIH